MIAPLHTPSLAISCRNIAVNEFEKVRILIEAMPISLVLEERSQKNNSRKKSLTTEGVNLLVVMTINHDIDLSSDFARG